MADDRIEIELILEDGSTVKAFTNVENRAEKAADKTSKSFLKRFSLLKGAIIGLGAAFGAAFAGRRVVEAANAQDSAIKELNTSLRLAGSFSQEASAQFQAFASELQATTRFGDEVILQQTALARNFARTNEEAQDLVAAAVDLSEATGITLDSAVRNLGKTFSGLQGELGESVPALRELTQEQLKAGAAIDLIADRFGGAAAANVQTFAGRTEQLSNVFGDLLEQIGFIVTRSPAIIAAFGKIAETITDITKGISESIGGQDLAKDLIINFSVIAQAGAETARRIGLSFELAFLRAQQAFFAFKVATTLGLSEAFNAELLKVNDAIDATKAKFADTSEVVKFFDDLILKVQQSSINLDNFKKTVNDTGDDISTTAKKIQFDVNTRVGQGISNAVQATVKAIASGEDAFAAFGKAALGVFGDLAIQVGQFYILSGLGIESLKALGGAAAIAAGIALVALGTLLKTAGGGQAGLGAGAAGAGPAQNVAEGGVLPGDTLAEEEADEEELLEPRTVVNVSVDGVVSDPTGVAQQLNDLLNDFADTNAGAIVNTV